MQVEISITDKTTGETVTYEDEDVPQEDWPPFIWSEGNFACDCNRALFFARAKDGPHATDPNHPCGEDRFTVRLTQGAESFDC